MTLRYEKPSTLDDALSLLARERWRVLAGGTDFYPAQGTRPFRENILDINGLAGLRGIAETGDGVVIGACTTWTDILRAPLPSAFDALKQAAREVGSVQIQNVGTVAGNLCNASPAADGVPALVILDAQVVLRSATGTRRLPLSAFILGSRTTALRPDELLTAIHVPAPAIAGRSAFVKLGARRYLVISIAMAAARVVVRNGLIEDAALAVGACSPVARRMPDLEAALLGCPVRDATARVSAGHLSALAPIDDVRGSAAYRRDAAAEIVRRALGACTADERIPA